MANITDNGELMDIFYEETQSLIDEMRQDLSALSQGQETTDEIACSSHGPFELSQARVLEQSATLRRLFRCAHIIKTSSASVGLDELNKITEALEKIFKKTSDERFVMTADVISLLSESVEACQKLLNEEEIAGYKELLNRLNSILQPSRG
jgi:chemotaxis protein histidine kinase CheA